MLWFYHVGMPNYYLEISFHHEYTVRKSVRPFRSVVFYCFLFLHSYTEAQIIVSCNCISLRGIFSYCSFPCVQTVRGTRSVRRTRTTRTPAHVVDSCNHSDTGRSMERFHPVSSLSCFVGDTGTWVCQRVTRVKNTYRRCRDEDGPNRAPPRATARSASLGRTRMMWVRPCTARMWAWPRLCIGWLRCGNGSLLESNSK